VGVFLALRAFHSVQDFVALIDSWSNLLLASEAHRVVKIADNAPILEMQLRREIKLGRHTAETSNCASGSDERLDHPNTSPMRPRPLRRMIKDLRSKRDDLWASSGTCMDSDGRRVDDFRSRNSHFRDRQNWSDRKPARPRFDRTRERSDRPRPSPQGRRLTGERLEERLHTCSRLPIFRRTIMTMRPSFPIAILPGIITELGRVS
jgi:hypothetical protein